LSKLNNLSKSKRRGNFEEQKKSEISGLESRLNFSKEELVVNLFINQHYIAYSY